MPWKRCAMAGILWIAASVPVLKAQDVAHLPASSGVPVALTLKRAVELALQNSKDIQLARLHVQIAEQGANLTHSEFLPNLYAGSGAGYTYGLPETPGGRPPSLFSVTYTEQILNGPLKGLAKEQQEEARAQRATLEETRNAVVTQVATSYLELVKVRHSLELLRKEKNNK